MIVELLVRFLIGGTVVSLFALLGDVLEPKTFAGIFGAAPSVALATLALAYKANGPSYVSLEARSMVLGSLALVLYSAAAARLVRKKDLPPWISAALLWLEWLAIALISFKLVLA